MHDSYRVVVQFVQFTPLCALHFLNFVHEFVHSCTPSIEVHLVPVDAEPAGNCTFDALLSDITAA